MCYSKNMENLIKELIEITERLELTEGVNQTEISNLTIRKHSTPITATSIFKPLFCLNLQGNKEITLGDDEYKYGPGQYILASADLALTGKVLNVSEERPFYGIIIEIDPIIIVEVLKDMSFYKVKNSTPKRALVVNCSDERLLNAIKRLLQTLDNENDIRFLSKLYIKEIVFLLLNTQHGHTLLQLGLMGTQFQRIKNSITYIIDNFRNKINVDKLAKDAGMSSSSFHKFFKEVTGLSPIQFQKKTRLMEAKGMIREGSNDISDIAFYVGYESPSQFSREYSREFGKSPKEDRVD